MAAKLPIVSTDIADVIELYGEAVSIATNTNEFIAACESALDATPQQRIGKIQAMRRLVATSSWENTAEQMRGLLAEAANNKIAFQSQVNLPIDDGEAAARTDDTARFPLPNATRIILKAAHKRTDG